MDTPKVNRAEIKEANSAYNSQAELQNKLKDDKK